MNIDYCDLFFKSACLKDLFISKQQDMKIDILLNEINQLKNMHSIILFLKVVTEKVSYF